MASGADTLEVTPRQLRWTVRGLMLGLFCGILSGTVVAVALPRVVADLGGGQAAYTWVVSANLLASTVSIPVWGGLADRAGRRALTLLALAVFAAGSALCGAAPDVLTLVACRAVQGIGAGGVTAMAQVMLAAAAGPRERGRYNGHFALVMAAGTVAGPPVGGLLAEAPGLGWRWCFLIGLPFAAAAALALGRAPRLPAPARRGPVDLAGAVLVTGSAGLLVGWASAAGDGFAWLSWQSAALAGGGLVLAVLFARHAARAADPLVPVRLLAGRTVAAAGVACLAVGTAVFAAPVLLGQYFQLARGHSPAVAGLLTLPMVAGMLVATTVTGRLTAATGRWKRYLVLGCALLALGFALMGAGAGRAPLWVLVLAMLAGGAGAGLAAQPLLLAVQTAVPEARLGAASALVVFCRALGGTFGVSALGALLAARLTAHLDGGAGTEAAYTAAFGEVFAWAAPVGLLALACALLMRETPLR
ncbi:EmrB/QacA subfamily drug resistance transporter [Thermocatellispora tengchongensis]|uniref:EmrB/QacA subfamily drug resistance transporter n=1 Tax=Thermocatellispora tengchongensis TaxID=1073253 RepID=A0A840PDY2_9ACTN|nr:MFS transporter [Thermocatellispora tengchongensis]MBB5139624.1 EmrB/QacA subfamily drug resistance transporter [Thermocatellispora tengchongensis]